MTRELKLALIVGFSLVLVVMVLVSDHLSKARKAELAGPANETALAQKLNTPSPQPLNPSDGSLAATTDPMLNSGPVTIAQGIDSPTSIEQQRVSLEEAARRMGMATREGNSTPLLDPTLMQTGEPPRVLSETATFAKYGNVTPVGDSGAPAPLNLEPTGPAKYTGGQGAVLGMTPEVEPTSIAVVSEATHTVESGESLFAIAKQHYGNGKYWKQLLEYNKASVKSETALRLGMKIKVPDLAVLTGQSADTLAAKTPEQALERIVKATPADPVREAVKPKAGKSKTYVVQKGDTPGAIAQKALGTSRRARELMELNRINNDGGLKIGMVLKLPN